MATFGRSDDLKAAEFVGVDLSGARFVESDLSGVVMRGVEVARTDIDAPWLGEGEFFRVNGVDVISFVEAELNRRFPGRADRQAGDPDGLRAAWSSLQSTWAVTLERAAAMPAGTVDVSVDGEWSFAQTLRHLVHAIDLWFGRSVLEREDFHPLGLRYGVEGSPDHPPYAEVLEVHASRFGLVRDFIATVTPAELDTARKNPHNANPETTRSCLHVILEEAWEHYRFATRDLDTIAAS